MARCSPHLLEPTWFRTYGDALTRAATSDANLRILFDGPPRHGKSELTKHGLALAARRPRKHAYLTYSAERAREVSLEWAALAKADGIGLSGTQRHWVTDCGSSVRFGSLDTALTGAGITGLCVIDDPYKDDTDASSKAKRGRIETSYRATVLTRLEGGASLVAMFTRWHPEDLAPVLIAQGFQHVHLPAFAEENDPNGRAVGEPLAPEIWSAEALNERRREVGEFHFQQLYQGRPRLRGEAVFTGGGRYYTKLPDKYSGAFGIDLAYTAKSSADYSGWLELWREENLKDRNFPRFYVVDMWRSQCELPVLVENIKRAHQRRPTFPIKLIGSGVEKGAVQMIYHAHRMRVNFKTASAGFDKFARAQDVRAAWNDGRVLLPDAVAFPDSKRWVGDFLDEIESFTGVGDETDDQVDMLINAHSALRVNRSWSPVARTTTTQSRTW